MRSTVRSLLAALLFLVTICVPPTAQARTVLVGPPGPALTLYQSWVDASRVPTADLREPVDLSECDAGHLTCTEWVGYDRRRHPEGTSLLLHFPDVSYLAGPGYLPGQLAEVHGVFMHEMGHTFDWAHRGSGLRAAFSRLVGTHSRWWSGPDWPGEQFGDAYALCALSRSVAAYYRGYGTYDPSPRTRRRVCALVRRVGST